MITYDDVPYELDEAASGLTLCLPAPVAGGPARQPYVIGEMRLTGGEAGPERGEFIGQDVMNLLVPASYADLQHWSQLDGVGNEQSGSGIGELSNRLLLTAEEPAGRTSEFMNMSVRYSYSLRAMDGFSFFLDLEGLFLPVKYASQCLFGFGPDKPSDEQLQEMLEPLRVMEVLPLWRVIVRVPPKTENPVEWARQAARGLGLADLLETPEGPYRRMREMPHRDRDPEAVELLTPWAGEQA